MRATTLERVAHLAALYNLTIDEVEAQVADARRCGLSRTEAISSVEARHLAAREWGDFYTDSDRIHEIALRLGMSRMDVRAAVHDIQVHLGLSRDEALDAVEAMDVQTKWQSAAAN